jgi:hypothetical protein
VVQPTLYLPLSRVIFPSAFPYFSKSVPRRQGLLVNLPAAAKPGALAAILKNLKFKKMKIIKRMASLIVFFSMSHLQAFSQTFPNAGEAKRFFENLDDDHNRAMVTKDFSFFDGNFADGFINCTRSGELNNKAEEIKSLLAMPLTKVERVAPQYEIFTYSGNLSTFSVTKKLTWKNASVNYVRRTTVYQLINGKWLAVSGQGTFVLPKYVE